MKITVDSDCSIELANNDIDLELILPTGKVIVFQSRPSNYQNEEYKGSFDILLPEEEPVVCWEGDDMKPAKPVSPNEPEVLFAKQLVLKL